VLHCRYGKFYKKPEYKPVTTVAQLKLGEYYGVELNMIDIDGLLTTLWYVGHYGGEAELNGTRVCVFKLLEDPARKDPANSGLVANARAEGASSHAPYTNYTVEGWAVKVWPADLPKLVRYQVKPKLPGLSN
jgi:hypothetical protein